MKILLKLVGGTLLGLFLLLGMVLILLGTLLAGGTYSSDFSLGAYSGAGGAMAVVKYAIEMAEHLHNCPPDNLDQCWDAKFPAAVIEYWAQECPGCSAASNGHLQCVMFAAAAYGVAGDPLPVISNAVDFWANYQSPRLRAQGWIEVPNGEGVPLPGDMVIMSSPYFGGVGHMAIVIDVKLPVSGKTGSITFAQANGPGAFNTFSLPPDLRLVTWPNYSVLGFIRHVKPLPPGLQSGLPSSPDIAVAVSEAQQAHIPIHAFVAQINLESHFNTLARSSTGAEGIAQIMPATAAAWGVDPWDPIASLWAAAQHMAAYQARYDGDFSKALAAYNAGIDAVDQSLRFGGDWLSYLPAESTMFGRLWRPDPVERRLPQSYVCFVSVRGVKQCSFPK